MNLHTIFPPVFELFRIYVASMKHSLNFADLKFSVCFSSAKLISAKKGVKICITETLS